MSTIKANLCKTDNLNAKLELFNLTKEPIKLGENMYCVLCKKPFTDCSFTRYPNKVLVHNACVIDENICPLTGQVFKYTKN